MIKVQTTYILHNYSQAKHIEPVLPVFPGIVHAADVETNYSTVLSILKRRSSAIFFTGSLFAKAWELLPSGIAYPRGIMLGHGVSEKFEAHHIMGVQSQPRVIVSSGPFHTNMLKTLGCDPDAICECGYFKALTAPRALGCVDYLLFCPTWYIPDDRGFQQYAQTIKQAADVVQLRVLVRPHPLTCQEHLDFIVQVFGQENVFQTATLDSWDLLSGARGVITDVGTTPFEALLLGKPQVIVFSSETDVQQHPMTAKLGIPVLRQDLRMLAKSVQSLGSVAAPSLVRLEDVFSFPDRPLSRLYKKIRDRCGIDISVGLPAEAVTYDSFLKRRFSMPDKAEEARLNALLDQVPRDGSDRRTNGDVWDIYVNACEQQNIFPGSNWGDKALWDSWFLHGFVEQLPPTARVFVEFGGGAGKYTERVLRHYPESIVYSFDVSPKFLGVMTEHLRHYVDSGRLVPVLMNSDPDFVENFLRERGVTSVDCLFSMDAMVHVDLQILIHYWRLAAKLLIAPQGAMVMTVANALSDLGFQKLMGDVKSFYPCGGTASMQFRWLCEPMVKDLLSRVGLPNFTVIPNGRDLFFVARK